MFASLSLEREPFTLHDLPAGFVSWLQDAGGFAMAFLVLMAFRRYILGRRATQSSGDAPSPFFSLSSALGIRIRLTKSVNCFGICSPSTFWLRFVLG